MRLVGGTRHGVGVAAVLLVAALAVAAPASAAEFIANGTFEGGSTSGWAGYNAGITVVTGGHSGTRSLKVVRSTGTYFSVIATPRPVGSTMAGVVYTGRAWLRSDVPKKTCLRIREYSGTTMVGSAESCLAVSKTWQQVSVSYTALGTARSLDMYLHEPVATTGDWFQIDDVSLATAAPADTTAPETTIDSGPSGTVASTSATFGFSSSEAGSTFACALDGGAFAACTSPTSYSGLSAATHSFAVRATDAAGNVDATPAIRSWTVQAADTTAPETTIDSGPSGTVASTSATFGFSSSEAGSTFACALDGAAFTPCASPTSYTSLSASTHSFAVRATDAAGNVDATPATRTWTVQGQPSSIPETTITSAPSGTVAVAIHDIAFSASDSAASFQCSLDGAPFAECSSPRHVAVSNGSHSFAVRAVNAAGTDATPATVSWWADPLLANGTFETALTGWTNFTVPGWKGYNASLAPAGDGLGGSGAAKISYGSGGSYSVYAAPRPVDAAVGGRTYTLTGWVRSDRTGRTVCARIREYGSGGATVGFAQQCLTATSAWQRVPAVSYLAAGGGQLDIDVFQSNSAAAGDSFELDDLQLDDGTTRTATPGASEPTLIAVGDIASCYMSGDDWTARIVDGIAGEIQSLGDNAYDHGSAGELAGCFGSSWGRFKDRYHPTPGDHEYDSGTADAYFDYFGAAAGERGKGWYSYDVGSWHVVVTNTGSCASVGGCGAGSEQEQWLRADLAAHPVECTVAVVDEPRFSSGNVHGSEDEMEPFWQALYDAGADLVLSGDDHVYERFAPQDPGGRADAAYGLREFVVGTGGYSHYGFGQPVPNSEVRNADTFGVLALTLRAGSYTWRFAPQSGRSFTDSGSGTCHGAPAASDTTAPTVAFTAPANGATVSGTVTLAVSAGDDVAVRRVEYSVNGSLVGTATAAPWSLGWSSTTAPDGAVSVTAKAYDAAGNSATATRSLVVDNTAPDTTISSGPPSSTTETSATFSFSSPDASATFECALDAGAWQSCTSPRTYASLAGGDHRFSVRAVDGAGNRDASPAVAAWTVAGSPPPPPPPPPANLIANGGFESGLGGWYGYKATLSLVAGTVGANAVHAVLSGTGTSFSVITSPPPVTSSSAGTRLTAQAWVRGDQPGRTLCLRVRELTSAGAAVGAAVGCVTSTGAWQQFAPVTYTTQAAGDKVEVYAFLDAATSGAAFDLDEVTLVQG